MTKPVTVDLSYKDNARRAYYDIEVLNDIFTILLMTEGHITLILLNDPKYNYVSDEEINKSISVWISEHRDDVEKVCGPNAEFDLRRYTTGEKMNALRSDLDTILASGSLWDTGEQFTEYAGWNSNYYDMPMMCGARLLFEGNSLDPAKVRALSDAVVSFDGKPWELWSSIEENTGLVREKSINVRMNLATYTDGHIDLALLARIVKSDDVGAESKFPPGLKKEMARSGMDIVIDDAVADADYNGLDHEEFLELLLYNANDVLGTGLVANNRVIVGQLKTRDIVRRMYPYTSARATPLEKVTVYTPAARDATAAQVASLVLVGPNRSKPRDYPAVNLTFPVPGEPRDLLEYMSENEDFMHPFMYKFFDHFRGKDTASSHDNWKVKKSQPITHSGQINIPYYKDGKPTNTYIRLSTGGAHGSVMAGLSDYSEEVVEQWIKSDTGALGNQKPTIDLNNVIHVDWSSFYPTMASKLQMYKTSDGEDRYTGIIDYRLKIKSELPKLKETWTPEDHALNEEQDGLKFILNSATGAGNMHRKFAMLPIDNKTLSMRLCGNLHIWCLCQRMTQAGGFIVSTNTDGFYVTNISLEKAQEVIDSYIELYGMAVEPEIIDRFINRDTSSRIEYQGDYRSSVSGPLTHGARTSYTDNSVGKNVSYPLAAAHAALRYMDDPQWLSTPYSRERLAGIVHDIYEGSTDAQPWYHIHAGSSVRHMTRNGEPLGKVNRVVLTREGDELGAEQANELTKAQALDMADAWSDDPSSETIVRVLNDLDMKPMREIPDGAQLVSYSKDEVTDELEESVDLSMYRLTKDRTMTLKLALKTDRGLVRLKVWKPTVLTGYPSSTGKVLNSRSDLEAFDLSEIDESAYVDWAESLLDNWKVTADLPEIGMESIDDTVVPKSESKRVTKADVAIAIIEEMYSNLTAKESA